MGNFTSHEGWVDCEETSVEVPEWMITQPAEEEEPFDFAKMPPDLQYKVVESLNYRDFSVLEQCCLMSHRICNEKKYTLEHFIPSIYINKKTVKVSTVYDYYDSQLPRVPWHIASREPAQLKADSINIPFRANSGRIQAAAKLFEKNGTRAEVLSLTEHIMFEPEDLDRLIRATQVKHFDSRQFVRKEFFQHPGLQNVNSMSLSTCGCTDDELVLLKADYIYMVNDFVTAKGLNRFLRQWKKKEREIVSVSIDFDSSFGTRNFDTILHGLNANPIWTPDQHEDSLVSGIKLDEFPPMATGDPEHLYCMFRADEPDDTRLIRLSMGRFEVFNTQNEADFLLSYLSDDQYYAVCKRCLYCGEEFCEHRRKYSVQRLKKLFPRVHGAFICGFKALGISFAAARVCLLLSGERPFTRVPPFENERIQHESGVSRLLSQLRVHLFDYV